MGGGGGEPTYISNDYEETMREALQAQIDLAPDLYKAESDNEFGRPAYARLNQRLVKEGLLGNEVTYDSEGRIVSGYSGGEGGRYQVVSEAYETQRKDSQGRPLYIDSDGNYTHRSSRYHVRGGTTTYKKAMTTANRYKLMDSSSGDEIGTYDNYDDAFGKGKELGAGDFQPIYKKDADGNVIQNKELAGQTIREGGGAVSLIAGDQFSHFSDGTTRRAGFDEYGNFMGTSALEQDMLERAKDQQTRTEVDLANRYGQGLTDAYRSQGGIQDALDSYNMLGRETSDHGGLRSALVGMASDELAAGGSLTDRERRRVEQTSRAAMGARGRGRDFAGVVDEVAANETLSRQRESERRLFASQVLGLADQGLAQDRAFAAQRIGLEQATSADPFMAITGRASGASVASGQSLYGNAAAGIGAGPTLYNPSQGAEFIANQTAGLNNFNANIYSSNQQAKAGMFGGAMGALGTIGGAAILACWVAREVYGVHSPKWMIFRHWMLFLSPVWFRATYLTFGERFAKFIRNKPRLKARIRAWMDSKIRETV